MIRHSKWIICASGPSFGEVSVDLLKRIHLSGWKILAVNRAWERVPFCDAMYAGDEDWWNHYGRFTLRYRGQKFAGHQKSAAKHDAVYIEKISAPGLRKTPGQVNSGGNSGHQGINLVWHLGANQIVLLGFDMRLDNGVHFHADYPDGMLNVPPMHIAVWRRNMWNMSLALAKEGVKVRNATKGSALKCFPMMNLEDVLCSLV
jgi:hypothetical protein